MRPDAKLGLFVFLVLVISVFFLVAHELSQRQPGESTDEMSAPGATASSEMIPAVDTAGSNPQWPAEAPVAAAPSAGEVPASQEVWTPSPSSSPSFTTVPAVSSSEYVVQQGDTLWIIAKKVYGKGSQWHQIFEANRDRLSTPEAMLKIGMRLMIPEAPASLLPPAPSAPWDSQLAGGPDVSGSGRMHVVESGESLYTIAKKYYGSGEKTKTDMIYAANRERMRSPDMLKVGMSLEIPDSPFGK